ncbi:MAG TPA: glycerol-3-phosphate acyltransferase, partial [Fibrobacteria bacterium]|nr:glycerol-3-phosphate acyltransferase [Fibrobacteria bacterium]
SFSFWIGFRGGKSVLTAFGVFLFLSPYASLGALSVWAAVMALSGYVSLASMVAALGLPLFIFLEAPGGTAHSPVFWAALPVCLFVIVRHRSNMLRLWRGEERKFRGKAESRE